MAFLSDHKFSIKLLIFALITSVFVGFLPFILSIVSSIALFLGSSVSSVIFSILFLVSYFLYGCFFYVYLRKTGFKIEISGLSKNAILIFFLASFANYLIFIPVYSALTCTLMNTTDCGAQPIGLDKIINPFFSFDCAGLICALDELRLWSFRYLVYLGPHNPITLFLGAYIAWKFLKW